MLTSLLCQPRRAKHHPKKISKEAYHKTSYPQNKEVQQLNLTLHDKITILNFMDDEAKALEDQSSKSHSTFLRQIPFAYTVIKTEAQVRMASLQQQGIRKYSIDA